jgi:DNA-binding FadR family transcriptional regulator
MSSPRFPRPALRSRLSEQVADQISTWIKENGLLPGDRLPPERARTAPVIEAIRAHADRLPEIIDARDALESLSQPGGPRESLAGHQRVADAIAAGDPDAAALAMHEHVMLVSDVALLREQS